MTGPSVELFWKLDDTESGLGGTRLAAAKLIAVYRLDADGAAVREGGPDWLDEVNVYEQGDPPTLVERSDGERFLRALPSAFRGIRMRATFIAGETVT
jgi:hypothetical protein